MSIPFAGFTGPSYQLENRYAAIEKLSNWYLVANESAEEGKFKLALAPSPGNQAFSELPVPAPFNQPNRGLLFNRDRVFGVNGTVVFEITSAGAYVELGTVVDDSKPASMVANGTGQIFIASGGEGYVIPKNPVPMSLIHVPITGTGFQGASSATFQDGYILVVVPNSNMIQISGDDATPLGDATIWDAANVSVQAGQADNLSSIISSREYVRILGYRRSQIYANVGNAGIGGFPFQSYNETFIETGISAPFSLCELGDSVIWIGQDARGQRACWRDHAFQPQRVSTFAIEWKWQQYDRIDDAVAFPFIWMGHLMYQITFPSASIHPVTGVKTAATWVYDATVSALLERNVWSERTYKDAYGYLQGRSEQFHCFGFGKHLVGSTGIDGNPGAVYQMESVGTTNQNPQLLLRWSNDGGNTYGIEQNIPVGLIGQYGQRVYWNRNGYARDRVYWVRYAEETECGTDIAGAQIQQPIVRDRICPHSFMGNKRVIYNRIEFELTRGIGSSDGMTPNLFSMGIVGAELDAIVCAS